MRPLATRTQAPGRHQRGRAPLLAVLTLPWLVGCASLAPDGAFGPTGQAVERHTGLKPGLARTPEDLDVIRKRVDELLAAPLDADAAVQVALLNHRGLQATFAELGIADAERVAVSRLPNPGFSFARKERGSELEIERALHIDLARLIALPAISQIEQRRVEALQQKVALQAIDHAAQTRRAWVQAVAAEESVRYRRQVLQAAEAGAELARRMEQAGNFSRLQRAREQGFLADAALDLARAEQAQRATRERLTRLMGLWGEQTGFRLPERLPDLPPPPVDRPDIEREALAQRLDVQAAKATVEQTARNLGLTQATRFVNVLELGLMYNSFNEAPSNERGWEIAIELPLFDWGTSRVARAEAIYLQQMHRAAAVAIDARSEVREAYSNLRFAWDIAKHHRDELVPLKRRISEENLLRYNGMFIGVFDLLADARSQIAGVNAAIDALRDYWLAATDLELAMLGKPPLAPVASAGPASTMTPADPH